MLERSVIDFSNDRLPVIDWNLRECYCKLYERRDRRSFMADID